MDVDLPSPSPELGAWLAENRDALIRRWLELVVERSTLDELAARPLGERVRELDLLLEAARSEGPGRSGMLAAEVEEALTDALAAGGPLALALLAPPRDGPAASAWTRAAAETARRDEHVVHAAGLTAIVIPAMAAGPARVEADRIRTGAWQLLGGRSLLPEVGVATCPDDAADAPGLVAAARQRLPEPVETGPSERRAARGNAPPPGPADFHADVRASRGEPGDELREELDLWAHQGRADADDERPPADVTPLYPPHPQ